MSNINEFFDISSYKLRDYQKEASKKGVEYFLEKKKRSKSNNGVIVAPTGSGKSLIIADIANKLNDKVLIFQPRKELLIQNYEKYIGYGNKASIYSSSMNKKEIGDVTFATIGSVVNEPEKFKDFKYCIIDECHTLPPNESSMYQQFLSKIDAKVLGLTATPFRLKQYNYPDKHSKINMLNRMRPKVFGEILHVTQIHELVEKGYFADTEYIEKEKMDKALLRLNSTKADYTLESMKYALDVKDVNEKVISFVQRAIKIGRKHIIIFVPSVAEAEYIAKKGGGEYIHAQTPIKKRKEVLQQFKNGNIPFIANVNILGIGFDFPELDTVVMARPTLSLATYYQWCVDEKTEILTDGGWVDIDNINYNQQIASVNIQNKKPKIIWENPLNIITRFIDDGEKMVNIQSPTIDMRFIDNHDMVVAWRSNKNDIKWKKEKAIDVSKRKDAYYIPIAAFEEVKYELPLSDDEIKFIGWFLTDGNLNKYNKTISISQSFKQPHFYEIKKTLERCNFKYNKFEIKAKTQFNENDKRYMYYVSYGDPQNKKQEKTGWKNLEEYIDKNFSLKLNGLSKRQLHILLETLHYGDGTKQLGQPWTRRSYHITTINETFADRLQSLCVKRGFKCNISYDKTSFGKTLYRIHIKNTFKKMVGGQNQIDRKSLSVNKPNKNERIWSVTVNSGNFIARRNGKVFVTGNCGRGVRPHPNKDKCLIVDFVGNIDKFGKVENLIIKPGDYGWGVYSNGNLLTNRDITSDDSEYKETEEGIMNFGKYKGEKMSDIPDWYMKWIWETIEEKPHSKKVLNYIRENFDFSKEDRLKNKK